MTITFISNYINHHQIPFSNALYELLGDDYHFIQTEPMEEERLAMGWSKEGEKLPYVLQLSEEEEKCRKLITDSDVLLAGWSGREDLVQARMLAGGLTVRISERIYREGQWKAISPKGLIHKYKEHTRFRSGAAYLLCAGAYVASDFSIIRAYPDKMYRWGYFPETRHYTSEQLTEMKAGRGRVDIVWAARFIPLKHPEYMLKLAKHLKENPVGDFHIHMVGGGEMEEEMKKLAAVYQVEDVLTFYGFRTPEEVREVMEKCHIFIFTSNHLEGWGAVVNEAMNSGCVPVANVQAGAVPYLIKHGDNGMVYSDDDFNKMEETVRYLIAHPEEVKVMGRRAYETITEQWNAGEAAKRLLAMIDGWQRGNARPPEEGPLSPAPVISPKRMFDFMMKEAKRR